MIQIFTRLAVLLLVILVVTTQGLADEFANAGWSENLEEEWCLQVTKKTICLPSDYELVGSGNDFAKFGPRSIYEPVTLIEYTLGGSQRQINFLLSSDVWVLSETQIFENVVVTVIVLSESQRQEAHGIVLSFLNFDNQFTLSINGSDSYSTDQKDLIKSIVAQWSASNTDAG